ncbi:MAG: gamma-glutamyl-gamma-aminobutyrate hydrolase family protein [Anaplasma sp.]
MLSFKSLRVLFCALLCAVFSFPLLPVFAGRSGQQDKVVVGFMQTKQETYPEELTFSYNIAEMLTKLGARVVLVDYNEIVRAASAGSSPEKGDKPKTHDLDPKRVKDEVLKFLEQEGVSRVFIPGNFYNLDTEPYPPTPHRQMVTEAIVQIARESSNIRLMAVCGGLQGVMHSLGVKVVRVEQLLGKGSAAAHAMSMPDPHDKNAPLHRMRVVPGSRLAQIVSEYVSQDQDGWLSLFFPDAHGGVVSNDPENVRKLESLGYKVVGFADDGIIEAVEDTYGNILFQDHPEALAINFLNGDVDPNPSGEGKSSRDSEDQRGKRYKAAIAAVSIVKDFLHR